MSLGHRKPRVIHRYQAGGRLGVTSTKEDWLLNQTTFAFHIPTSTDVVLLVEITLPPRHFGGGGSLSNSMYTPCYTALHTY
jgi:hypothetical protein